MIQTKWKIKRKEQRKNRVKSRNTLKNNFGIVNKTWMPDDSKENVYILLIFLFSYNILLLEQRALILNIYI